MTQLKDWQITQEDWEDITHKGEYDGFSQLLWDNGVYTDKDAASALLFMRSSEYDQLDCPKCRIRCDHHELPSGRYLCRYCRHQFSITSGTYLDRSHLTYLQVVRWAHLITKFRIRNTVVLAEDIGVTHKSAFWLMQTFKEARRPILEAKGIKLTNGEIYFQDLHHYDVFGALLTMKEPSPWKWSPKMIQYFKDDGIDTSTLPQ